MDILYGVKKVILTELDPTTELAKGGGIVCSIKTAEEVELNTVYSKGNEKVLRNENQILAVASTDDLIYGYNLKLKDNVLNIDALGLIEGGTVRKSGQDIVGYDTPVMASGSTMKLFKAEIYVANYSGNTIVNYTKITLNKCKGYLKKVSYKEDFFAPEFDIEAREATKASKSVKNIDYVSSLPSDDSTPPTLTMVTGASLTKPAVATGKSTELGGIFLAIAAATVDSISDLSALLNMGVASYSSVTVINTNTDIATSALPSGTYKMYAVDTVGNVSTPSTTVTLS